MRFSITFLLIVWGCFTLSAQITEDFSDGNFNQNPTWIGDTLDFKISTSSAIPPEMKPALQLDMESTDSSYLSLPNTMMDETEWNFWVKLSFNTSENNNAKVYLTSDQSNLTNSLNGYFVQIGGVNDSIALFRQDGLETHLIIKGTHAFTGNSTNTIRIKVTRKNNGLWQLFSDPEGGINYFEEGQVTDNTYSASSYFGFYCKYTGSNSTKFYFDDFFIQAIDIIPPEIESVLMVSPTEIVVVFNEVLEIQSAEQENNFYISPEIGNPDSAIINEDHSKVNLIFNQFMNAGITYLLEASNISDINGNIQENTSFEFVFEQPYNANEFDLVINELMIDPSPEIGLPEYEYIELFNRTDHTIFIDGWTFLIGSTEKIIDEASVLPYGYLILTNDEAAGIFGLFGEVISFSSLSLNNTGQILTLLDENQTPISSVSYTDEWYHDPEKEDGGWSIERINPDEVCVGEDNWKASNSYDGGTPGAINSVYENTIFEGKIKVLIVENEYTLILNFNQKINIDEASNSNFFLVDNGIGHPDSVTFDHITQTELTLIFPKAFESGVTYTLSFPNDLSNCQNEKLLLEDAVFGLPESAEKGDIIINEVLFNPRNDGVDFVELYNISEKFIDLSSLYLGSVDYNEIDPNDTIFKSVSAEKLLFFPGSYLALSKNQNKIKEQYFTENEDAFFDMNSFPSYNNDFGTVILHSWFKEIDLCYYDENMHHPLLKDYEGVSLEKVNPYILSSETTNWHSAAEAVGYATPGYQNSQYSELTEIEKAIEVSPEIFSPDMDGYHDFLNIQYHFTNPGNIANIVIFDAAGRLIIKLVNNALLATSGSYIWDGRTEDHLKAPIGIYVIYVEVFNTKGVVKKYKETAVLGGKL